jgi:hypothetical protein
MSQITIKPKEQAFPKYNTCRFTFKHNVPLFHGGLGFRVFVSWWFRVRVFVSWWFRVRVFVSWWFRVRVFVSWWFRVRVFVSWWFRV